MAARNLEYVAKCDGCSERAKKRAGRPCPDHWFYLESVRQSDCHVYIVWACSETCRDKLWQRGPGPVNLDEEGGQREIAKRAAAAGS